MRAIVGLGNPGSEYAGTRHNAGFLLADALAGRWRLTPWRRSRLADVALGTVGDQTVALIKPRTYMNDSGTAMGPLLAEPGFEPGRDLLVVVDDVALPGGAFRLRAQGSAGGHHGLESIEDALHSQRYARLRIGIGPAPAATADLAEFVLAAFTPEEAATLHDLVPSIGEAVACWISEGIEPAMNRFNKRAEAGS